MFVKGNSSKERFLFILISIFIITALNVTVRDVNLWSLSLLPVIALLHYRPEWKMAVCSILAVFIGEIGIAYITSEVTKELVENFIINTIIISVFALSNVKKETSLVTDPLTGALNRKFFNAFVKDSKNLKNLSVNLLDIDHFKRINDTYGHDTGDFVLSELVKVIQKNIRHTDKLVRLGGEEFAILCANTKEEEGYQMAERICDIVRNTHFSCEGNTIPVTVSIGFTYLNDNKKVENTNNANFLKRADEALYMAKQNGRNQVISLA